MPYKRKYTKKRKPRRKKYSRKKLYRKHVKKYSNTACSVVDNHDLDLTWNGGLGDWVYNTAVENITTGPARWQRLGSIIKPLGYKVNIDARFPAQELSTTNSTNSVIIPLTFKFIIFQYNHREVESTTYQDLKLETKIDGATYVNHRTDIFNSNNPFNRGTYKIIFEKTFQMEPQYWHEASGIAVTEFAPRTAPCWITKSFYIPGRKMSEIKYKQGEPLGTTTGGIGYVVCGQNNEGNYVVNAVPSMTITGTLYYEP